MKFIFGVLLGTILGAIGSITALSRVISKTPHLNQVVKELIGDSIYQGLTGEKPFPSQRSRVSYRPGRRPYERRIPYSQHTNRQVPWSPRKNAERDGYEDALVKTGDEAMRVIDKLSLLIDEFGSASISDLYDLIGVVGTVADSNWGWEDITGASFKKERGGFRLILPYPLPLEEPVRASSTQNEETQSEDHQ